MRKFISGLVAVSVLMVSVAMAQTMVSAKASWNAPTEGSPVVTYVFQLSEEGGAFVTYATTDTTFINVDLELHKTYVARVAGVDALDRQGPWSMPSDPYTPDLGVPGAPSQPIIFE